MVFYGYLLIIAVVGVLLLLSERVFNKFLNGEYCRKILHIGTFSALPLANVFFGAGSIHFVIVCAIFSVATLIMYFVKAFKTIDSRKKNYPGIFYYALSLLIMSIVCYFNKSLSVYFGVGFIGLAFGDGFATLLGYAFKSKKIYQQKTIVGFITCILVTFLALIIYNCINDSFLSVYQMLLLAVLTGIVELVDLGLDNLFIPLSLFLISVLLKASNQIVVALTIAEGVFLIAFFCNVIKYYGALLASFIGFCFYYLGGLSCLLFVVGCYVIMISVSIVGKLLKNDLSNVVKKNKAKDFLEILVNGIWSLIGLLIFAVTKNEVFLAISLIALSAGFTDSLASDVGTLSKKPPFDFIKKEYVQKGISGGVTALGSIASLIGAIAFSTAITIIFELKFYFVLIITLIIYFGCILDTVLGSTLQIKYKCVNCGIITERESHCNLPTQKVSGFAIFNNDTVNLISGFGVFALSFIIIILI